MFIADLEPWAVHNHALIIFAFDLHVYIHIHMENSCQPRRLIALPGSLKSCRKMSSLYKRRGRYHEID